MAGFIPAIDVFLAVDEAVKTWMAGTSSAKTCFALLAPAMTIVNTIGFVEVTANFYFFAGAILESFAASGALAASAGLASGLAPGVLAA
jgi:hypothetical protein